MTLPQGTALTFVEGSDYRFDMEMYERIVFRFGRFDYGVWFVDTHDWTRPLGNPDPATVGVVFR